MALPSRPSDFDARFLRRMVGTKVTTFYDIDPPQELSAVSPSASGISASVASLPAVPPPRISPPGVCRSWIITEKLSERAVYLPKEQVQMDVGTPMTVGKFMCYLEEDPTQIAFMRIYYQIPITGTEDADLATLAQQIHPPELCGEREAFKQLRSQGCSAVPGFLGYDESTQGEHDLVPGGYIKYVVWEKVPGESLTEEFFWSLDRPIRDDIRAKFRAAFEEVLRCGVVPQISRISKIIYDPSTGNVRISGFRMGWPIRDKLQWSDTRDVAYRLAKRPEWDWRRHPENWEL